MFEWSRTCIVSCEECGHGEEFTVLTNTQDDDAATAELVEQMRETGWQVEPDICRDCITEFSATRPPSNGESL